MADLLGRAVIRVDMSTATALQAVKKLAKDAEKPLDDLKGRVAGVTSELAALQALAGEIKVKATLEDDTTAGVASITTALTALGQQEAKVRVTLDDDTGTGIADVTTSVTALKALSPVELKVTLEDDTATGAAAARTAVTQLQALSPVDITVQFDDQSGQVSATATAVQALRTRASAAATALRSVATRSTAAAAALALVDAAAEAAARSLNDLTTRAAAATVAVRDLRSEVSRLATALRRVDDRASSANDNLTRLGDRTVLVRRDMDDFGDSVTRVGDGLRGLRGNIPSLNSALRSTSAAAGGGGGGGRGAGVVGALGAVAAVSAAAAAALGTAVPLVAGIGAALAAVAPAAGVAATGILTAVTAGAALKIGLQGLDEAFKNAFDPDSAEAFNEAMKNLAPNARSFVQAIRGMAPAFKELRLDVQDRLFQGFGKSLESTGKVLLPTVRKSLVDAAGSLNAMGRGVLTTARDLGKSGALGTALKGANQGLKDFRALPSTIVQGLVQVGAAAAPAFNRLTGAARGGIERLSDSIADAFESGRMEKSISRAASLAKDLGSALSNVGGILSNVLGAADASGSGVIQNFKAITAELEEITGSAAVQGGLRTLFETMGTVGRTAAGLLGEALKAVAPVITALGPPAQTLVRSLGAGLTPVIRSLSPILTSAAESFGRIVTAVSPLVAVVGRLVSGALDGLAPILREVGEQGALLAESASALLGPALQQLPKFLNPLMKLFGELGALWISIQNDVLKALQPSLTQLGESLGRVAKELAPLLPLFTDFISGGLRGLAKAITPAIEAGGKLATLLTGKLAGGIEHLAKWAGAHKLELMEIFNNGKVAVLDFTISVVESLPTVFSIFRQLAVVALDAFGAVLNGASHAFGWIPGIGPKIKDAAAGFSLFSDLAKKGLDKAGKKIDEFTVGALPKLKQNRLEMQIDNWESQIKEAKRQLSDKNLPSRKRAELLADIKQWEKNVAQAKKSIGGVEGVARKITVSTNARGVAGSAQGAIKSVKDGKPKITVTTNAPRVAGSAQGAIKSVKDSKPKINVSTDAPGVARSARGALGSVKDRRPQIRVGSNARSAARATARALNNISDENVYIRVSRIGLGEVARRAGASGGLVPGGLRRLQGGGPVRGPGTETSDSIPALLSRGEFVVRAAAVRRYGASLFEALNSMRMPQFARGGQAAGVPGFMQGLESLLASLRTVSREIADRVARAVREAMGSVQGAGRVSTLPSHAASGAVSAARSATRTGMGAAVEELRRLVDSGRWTRRGSLLFEDISFQGMSGNFARHQEAVADQFWAAVQEIKKAVRSGTRVHEDMTFRGMSATVRRFHSAIADIWRGNPWGTTFGDWGRSAPQGSDLPRMAGGGLIRGRGTGTSDSNLLAASDGEFLVRAAAVRHYGPELFHLLNTMRVPAAGGGGGASGGAAAVPLHLTVENHGVIGSEAEILEWLTRALARLQSQRRLPTAFGGRAA